MTVKIAFICTGNSARSQIAEGFGKHFVKKFGKDIEIFSAGSNPAGYIHPLAIKVMKEKGIDISQNKSKSLNDIPLNQIDFIITLCDSASQNCPVIYEANVQHWGLPDPAEAKGTEEERINAFRKIRDEIEEKVKNFILESVYKTI